MIMWSGQQLDDDELEERYKAWRRQQEPRRLDRVRIIAWGIVWLLAMFFGALSLYCALIFAAWWVQR